METGLLHGRWSCVGPSTRWGLLVAAICMASGAMSCDSKTRGERQTPASADHNRTVDRPARQQADATVPTVAPPEVSDLQRFTADIAGHGPLVATIQTTLGDIHCRLYAKRAPVTVTNFVGLATGKKAWVDPDTGQTQRGEPFYRGVEFDRVIPDFFIQTGGHASHGHSGPGYVIPDEFDPALRHDRPGVLSMANKGRPNSGASRWFITQAPIPHLDGRHSVFGQCKDLDVVKSIARAPAGPDNHPQKPPTITQITFCRQSARAPACGSR